ncbi:MAG: beta-propeller fold lactonase family protein [Armatimonadetes bacterium]|nr:beta-propeller fold lactonase family protein [Armatimonadota bacterium]
MRRSTRRIFGGCFIATLFGCGGLLGGGGGTGNTHSFYIYATNFATNDISQFVAKDDGTLALVGRYPTGNGPTAIADDGNHIFVVNQTDGTIGSFAKDVIGRLKLENTYPVSGTPVALVSSGTQGQSQELACACAGSNNLYLFQDDNGVLTQKSIQTTGNIPSSLAKAVDYYCTNLGDGTVSRFGYSSTTFGPRNPATVNVGSGPISFVANSWHLFVLNSVDDSVTSLTENVPNSFTEPPSVSVNGTLHVNGSTPTAGAYIINGKLGDGLYIANRGSSTINRLNVDHDGILTASGVADTASGSLPNAMAAGGYAPNSAGQLLYELDDAGQVRGYAMGTDGSLSLIGTFATGGSQSKAMVVDPDGYQLYDNTVISWDTSSLINGTVGSAYTQNLHLIGAPYWYGSIVAGALPDGLALSTDHYGSTIISGTPTTAGTFTFTVQATTGLQTIQREFTILVSTQGTSNTANVSVATGLFGFPGNDPDIKFGSVDFGYVVAYHDYQMINVGSQTLSVSDNAGHVVKTFQVNPTGDKRWIYAPVGDSGDGFDLITDSFDVGTAPASGTAWITVMHGIKGLTETTDMYIIPTGMTIGNTPYKIAGMTPLTAQTVTLNLPSATTFTIVATEPGQPTNIIAQSAATNISPGGSRIELLVSPPSAAAYWSGSAETIP